jgi:pentose-5-phosphate-3-epimerase
MVQGGKQEREMTPSKIYEMMRENVKNILLFTPNLGGGSRHRLEEVCKRLGQKAREPYMRES